MEDQKHFVSLFKRFWWKATTKVSYNFNNNTKEHLISLFFFIFSGNLESIFLLIQKLFQLLTCTSVSVYRLRCTWRMDFVHQELNLVNQPRAKNWQNVFDLSRRWRLFLCRAWQSRRQQEETWRSPCWVQTLPVLPNEAGKVDASPQNDGR